jgi:hypothetical protein
MADAIPLPIVRPASMGPSAISGPITAPAAAPTPVTQAQSQATPYQIQAMQAYADEMSKQATDQTKNQWGVPGGISSPTQGLAKMIEAWMGGRAAAMAGQGQAAGYRSGVGDPSNPQGSYGINPLSPQRVATQAITPSTPPPLASGPVPGSFSPSWFPVPPQSPGWPGSPPPSGS